jgi:GT2 family glycosyltransferase
MVDLSVIIVNWNTRDLLAQCLQSVYRTAQGLEFEVFVVDNASSDGSVQMVRERFPQVRLLENAENVGFARANNQAIRESARQYVLLLNSDVVVQHGSLARLRAFMDTHPEAGIVGGKLLWPDGSFQSSFNDFPSFISELLLLCGLARSVYGPYFPSYGPTDSQEPRAVDWVGGAFLCVRGEAIADVGLLDESYFMYGEEMDWCYQMWQKGWKVYFLPEACVIHHGGQSSKLAGSDTLLRLTRSHLRFANKYWGGFAANVLAAWARIASLTKSIMWFSIGLVLRKNRSVAWEKAKVNWRLTNSNLL